MRATMLALVVMALTATSAHAENFTLTINGKKFEVDLDTEKVLKVGGRKLRVKLAKKTVVLFKTVNFSFDHPSRLSPSRTGLGNGIFQTMMASPVGTLVMVQEYTTLDPSGLVDLMVGELTKEEVKYGYKIVKKAISRKLASGARLKGKLVTSTYRSKVIVRQVLTFKARDAGVLLVTQIEKTSPVAEAKIIDTFYKTLKITMK